MFGSYYIPNHQTILYESALSVPGNSLPEEAAEGELEEDYPATEPRPDTRRHCFPLPNLDQDSPENAEGTPQLQTNEVYANAIAEVCDDLKAFLLAKNRSYGNSAFEPINIFSQLSPVEGIYLRIDDKLKRIKNGAAYSGDNDYLDLTGYLILLLAYFKVT